MQNAHDDPGLQPERTSLAWTRTLLGFLVVAAISLRTAHHTGVHGVATALVYSTVALVIAVRRAPRYAWSVEGIRSETALPAACEVFVLSTVTTALALHALWFSAT